MIGRGEHCEIAHLRRQSVDHELSGNMIDLCPVGALNNKPFRYRARAWELTAAPLVSPHDCVGTNLFVQVQRGRVMRVVPRENEDDQRDAGSPTATASATKALQRRPPAQRRCCKQDGEWQEVDWETALEYVAERPEGASARARRRRRSARWRRRTRRSKNCTCSRAARARPRQRQHRSPPAPARLPRPGRRAGGAAGSAADRRARAARARAGRRLVTCARTVPLLAHRLRQAARKGAQVAFVQSATRYD